MSDEKKTRHGCRLCQESWHSLDEQAVFAELQSRPEGLEPQEAERRLRFYGPNALPSQEPPGILRILLHQILNPLIFILLAAAGASILIGELTDAIFIFIVIAINSGLGAIQEQRAEKGAASLQQLLKITARVRREGQERELPAEELVPGDIVLLETGNKVPADLRLIASHNLAADESFLTGESIATDKETGRLAEDTRVSDRFNMVFAGATITAGRATGIAVGTGQETQVGLIAKSVSESQGGKPPLVLRMDRFVKHVSIAVLFIALGLAVLLARQGNDLTSIFFFVVALAVSAIPEGLPVALTVALSIASKRMSDRQVIVRKLNSVESLGSCTVIASDKTGTLTVNQQTARRILLPDNSSFSVSGEGYDGDGVVSAADGAEPASESRRRLQILVESAILANEATLMLQDEAWTHRGDAMDVAFLALGYKLGLDPAQTREKAELTYEIPYEPQQKYSAAFYLKDGSPRVAVKGAAETVLGFCALSSQNGKLEKLDHEKIERQAESMAEEGLRVLAVAGGEIGEAVDADSDLAAKLEGLIFYGLVGFIDPLRAEAAEAVWKCKKAGIRVIMITGDHPATAGAIARELQLSDRTEAVVTGRELSEAGTPDSPAFEKLVSSTHVFARVSPTQKLEIVDVLIRRGEFVAVTGDGVNDAPALRRANIGVAMGSGTDVAKEIGSMIVADDNFSSIVAGVEEGRFAYDNVRKVIYLLISTGVAEVLMFLAAILTGLPIPLLAVQLLWLNLVTNGIQDVALAFEGGEPGAMERKPRRPEERIFNAQMLSQTLVSSLTIGALAFCLWFWLIEIKMANEAFARNYVLLLMVLLQNVHVFNCRSETSSTFRVPLKRNTILILGVLAAQGIHLLSMHLPFMQNLLGLQTVSFSDWLITMALALTVLGVMEVFKLVKRLSSSSARLPGRA